MRMWIVSRGLKKVCVHVKVCFFLFYYYFKDSVGCLFKKINEKTLWKYKYLQMTVLYTKYKAENNALKIYWGLEIWAWKSMAFYIYLYIFMNFYFIL